MAFALETALLFAVAYGAITAFPRYAAVAAVAALAAGVLLWGVLMAPRAKTACRGRHCHWSQPGPS
ncbi:DUF2568 domain-containing protein [Arthrobacter sp. ATA002]|uniref:DUF2568 domain-containing protein n=1 Tax=Arthrobacter sp. ATA002 TaxID=2991715 RepID=UPI003FA4C321